MSTQTLHVAGTPLNLVIARHIIGGNYLWEQTKSTVDHREVK